MHRQVPTPPKDVNIVCIPPIVVEVAISKVKQLSQEIEE
jgi:hypothetical protein